MRAITLLLVLLVLCLAPAVQAQDDCPALIATALETVDAACESTGRNQVCYGNVTVDATPREGAPAFRFEQAGDIVGVADVARLRLSSFGQASAEWGVALLKLQANLPDTLPGQNVTMLLFGDVNLADAGERIVELPVTATRGVNVRQRPTTEASVIRSLSQGQAVTATGRLADGSWVRVRLEDGPEGWVSAGFLDGDLPGLRAVEPGAPVFGPMQAFTFTTGLGDAPCETAPASGILIQTPEGAGTVRLQANGVDIALGSTVYLQAAAGDSLTVSVLEGHATLTAQGQTQVVPARTVGRVPLDANGFASGPPEYPEPYDYPSLRYLPVSSRLLTPVEVRRALVQADIADAIARLVGSSAGPAVQTAPAANGGNTAPGNTGSGPSQWVQNETVTYNTCPGPLSVGDTNRWYPNLVFSPDRQSFTYDGGPNNTTVTLGRSGDNTYQGVFGDETFYFTFTSPTTYQFSWVGVHGDPNNGGCRFVMDATATLISGTPW